MDLGACGDYGVSVTRKRPEDFTDVSIDLDSDDDLREIFGSIFAADAQELQLARANHTRMFKTHDISNLFRELKRNPSIAHVKGYNDFPYTKNNTLATPLIEREYWLRLHVGQLRVDPTDGNAYTLGSFLDQYGEEDGRRHWNTADVSKSKCAGGKERSNSEKPGRLEGNDGFAILHVHYAGRWQERWQDRDRSVITQINIRHTWDGSKPEEDKFHKKCEDLDKWREKKGTQVLGEDEAPGGWRWRDDSQRDLTYFTSCLRDILERGEERTVHRVRKKYLDYAQEAGTAVEYGHASGTAIKRSERKPLFELGERVDGWRSLRLSALCIGVGAYPGLSRLDNPVRDAEAVFEAINKCANCRAAIVRDPKDKKTIRHHLKDKFLKELAALPAGELPEVVTVLMGGHGIQHGRDVFLIPVSALTESDDETELKEECMSHLTVLEYMQKFLGAQADKVQKKIKFLLVMDMCRVGGALASTDAHIEPDASTVPSCWSICYSTSRGMVAADGDQGSHSPLVRGLIDPQSGIFSPGVSLEVGIKNACKLVVQMSGADTPQRPIHILLEDIGDLILQPAASDKRPAVSETAQMASEYKLHEVELIKFLGSAGLCKIAQDICDKLRISRKEDLFKVSKRDFDRLDLLDWERENLFELVNTTKKAVAGAVSLNGNDLDHSDISVLHDSDISEASTQSARGISSDLLSDSENGMDLGYDAVVVKHPGNPEDFQEHMRGFIRTFLSHLWIIEAAIESGETFKILGDDRPHGEWTYCTLVWTSFVKEASIDESSCGLWCECLKIPAQDRFLVALDSFLRQDRIKHNMWTHSDIKSKCTKQFTASICLTHKVVQHYLKGHAESLGIWERVILNDWFDNDEEASVFLLRANTFLRKHIVDGIRVIEHVVKTQSYVAFLRMPKLASLLLFSYLNNLKDNLTAGAARNKSLHFHGFRMIISSSSQTFSLADNDAPMQSVMPIVRQGLQCLAWLPAEAWEMMGPVSTVKDFLSVYDLARIAEPQARDLRKELLSEASRLAEQSSASKQLQSVQLQTATTLKYANSAFHATRSVQANEHIPNYASNSKLQAEYLKLEDQTLRSETSELMHSRFPSELMASRLLSQQEMLNAAIIPDIKIEHSLARISELEAEVLRLQSLILEVTSQVEEPAQIPELLGTALIESQQDDKALLKEVSFLKTDIPDWSKAETAESAMAIKELQSVVDDKNTSAADVGSRAKAALRQERSGAASAPAARRGEHDTAVTAAPTAIYKHMKTLADDVGIHRLRLAIVEDPEGFFERAAAENLDSVTIKEFTRACTGCVQDISQSAVASIFCQLDTDNNGQISMTELLQTTEMIRHFYKESKIEFVTFSVLMGLVYDCRSKKGPSDAGDDREQPLLDLAELPESVMREGLADKVPKALAEYGYVVKETILKSKKHGNQKEDQHAGKFDIDTATYGTVSAYHTGLDAIGTPHPNIFEEMKIETNDCKDSGDTFEAWNSGVNLTIPRKEWDYVYEPFKKVSEDKPPSDWEQKHDGDWGGNRFPIRLQVFMHAHSAIPMSRPMGASLFGKDKPSQYGELSFFGDYKEAHEKWDVSDPRWLHPEEVSMVKVVILRFVRSQLDGVSLINALNKHDNLRGKYSVEQANIKANEIVKALDEGLRGKDGAHSSCSYGFLVDALARILTKEEVEAIIDHFHKKLADAELSEAEVIGLRLYSGPLYVKMNSSLRAVGAHVKMVVSLPCTPGKGIENVLEVFKSVVGVVARVEPNKVSIDSVLQLETSTLIEFRVGVPPKQEEADKVLERMTVGLGDINAGLAENNVLNISVVQAADIMAFPDHLKGNRYVNTIYACSSGMRKMSRVSRIPRGRRVYRGMGGVKFSKEFLMIREGGGSGGVDFAFMSTTTRKEIAVSYIGDKGLPVLFECEVGDIDRGTSLSHVSQYPNEDEVLIPAMSYLEITGKSHVMETIIRHGSENRSVLVTVYPARINCNQKSQTIEEIEARRKHDLKGMTFYIDQEIQRDLPPIVELLRVELSDQKMEGLKLVCEKVLDDFAKKREEWDKLDAKEFNSDINYKKHINCAIDFKHDGIVQLCKFVYEKDFYEKFLTPDNIVHVVIKKGNADLAKHLLYLGFSLHPVGKVNDQDIRGETRLASACRMGNLDIFEALLKARADVNVVRNDGASALQLAMVSDNDRSFEMFNSLIQAGADVKLDVRDNMGETLLATACRMGNFEMFEALLNARADVNVVRRDGKSALQLAIVSGHTRSFEMFEALIKAGADVKLEAHDNMGETLLVTACRMGSFEIFEYLLNAGSDFNVARRDGASALALAIVAGNAKILNLMPNMIECDDSLRLSTYLHNLSLAFLHTSSIHRWLEGGWSPRGLTCVIGALLSTSEVNPAIKDRLSDLRSFINHHGALLQNPSPLLPLSLGHVVEQLASQESVAVFDSVVENMSISTIKDAAKFIEWINKPPVQHPCKFTMQADGGEVRSVTYHGLPLGLKWQNYGTTEPTEGRPLANEKLAEALETKTEFTIVDWDTFGVGVEDLRVNDYIKSGSYFFKSAVHRSMLARAEEKKVVVCDAVSGFEVCRLEGHRDPITAVRFSADGACIATASFDKSVRLWDVATSSCKMVLEGHTGKDGQVVAVAFSPDGTKIVSGSNDRNVKVWDVSTGDCVWTFAGHRAPVNGVAFSANGKVIASCSGGPGHKDHSTRLWCAETGEQTRILRGHTKGVTAVRFSADCASIASASQDQSIRLWDVASGSCKMTLKGHSAEVNAVDFAPGGTKVVSGSTDKNVKLWEVAGGSCILTLDGHSGDSTTRIWSIATRVKKGAHESEKVNISETSSTQQTVGKHIITAKEDLLLISEDQKVVAFFRAPAHITTMQFVSDMIVADCSNGDSVHLRAPCLVAIS